jgi:hypothetical protein
VFEFHEPVMYVCMYAFFFVFGGGAVHL